jgi:murein L,D-transpeptidase YcbB/YkuD
MATAIAELDPAYPAYRRLQEALPRYRRIAAAGDQPALPGEGMVRPGERYDGATQLAAFLQRTGDLRKSHRGDLYDGSLAVAVRRFQRRHGLPDDGIIGAETRRELDVPLSRRVRQIELALERWRSIPSFERPPVLVNIPEFKLYALDENLRPALEMKVIVGQALLHNTLVFQSTISSLVFQPTWNVPPSIQQSEIVPRLQRDRGYLARKGFEVVRHGQASSGTSAVTDSILADLRAGRRAIRQKPGSANALGQLKFVLRNDGNIYLHDTPSKELFDEARRDFSHGCIRVQQPAALAAWLLRDTAGWTGARIQRAMRSGDGTRELSLGAPVPILMMYATAAVAPDGEVRFFRDIYGYDERLERELMQRRAGDRMAEASEVPGSERGSRPRAAVQPDPDNGR